MLTVANVHKKKHSHFSLSKRPGSKIFKARESNIESLQPSGQDSPFVKFLETQAPC